MTREQLLPQEVLSRLPAIGETENIPVAQVKFFYPDFDWTWYGVEFDGDDLFFGLVEGAEAELGYFRLSELMANRGHLGCEIERDLYFVPTYLDTLMAE